MRTPSWKISVERPEMLPGTMPPMSPQWARMHDTMRRRPSAKNGLITSTSFRWVPEVKGSFARRTSPGARSSENRASACGTWRFIGPTCSGESSRESASSRPRPSVNAQEKSWPS